MNREVFLEAPMSLDAPKMTSIQATTINQCFIEPRVCDICGSHQTLIPLEKENFSIGFPPAFLALKGSYS